MISRRAAITIAFLSAILSLPTRAADEPPLPVPDVAAKIPMDGHYPAEKVNFPNGVVGVPGIVYEQWTGYRPLQLDLYLPPNFVERPAAGFPLVIFIHGGGWLDDDRRHNVPFADFPSVLASLSVRGYVVASVDYRLSTEAIFPAQIQDVKTAIRWLRLHASEYGIDRTRVMTWGTSAGGHLAALAAVSCDAAALEPRGATTGPNNSSTVSDCVQGGAVWYGVLDIATIAAQARDDKAMSRDVPDVPEWRLLGCFASACKNGEIDAASPTHYVDPTDPPLLLIVGTDDTIVPYHQTLEMAETLKAAGVAYELIVMPGLDHSLTGKTVEQTRDANFKALQATFRFFDEKIGKATRIVEQH